MLPKRSSMTTHRKLSTAALMVGAVLCQFSPVWSQDASNFKPHHHCVDWTKLNLTNSQNEKIRVLQADWNEKYGAVMPEIRFQQQHLQDLFRDPHSDPLEIVSTQQSLIRLQEQLRSDAMTNYLHKRALLSDLQQKQLETQVHEMVVERQQRPMLQPNDASDQSGLGNIMQKIRWAIGAH